jgi:hypothetical protein
MANLTLPNGQIISEQDPNYEEYKKTYPTAEIPSASDTLKIDNADGVINSSYATSNADIEEMLKKSNTDIANYQSQMDKITLPSVSAISTAEIERAMNAPVEISDTAKKQQELIQQQLAKSEAAGVAEQADIKQQYATREEETKEAQFVAGEQAKAAFAAIGITPETSSQMIQYLQDTMTTNNKALLSITQAQNAALRQAQEARDNQNFELMNLALTKASEAEDRANQLKQQAIENSFALANLQMQAAQFNYSVGMDAANFTQKQLEIGISVAQNALAAGLNAEDAKIKAQSALREQLDWDMKVEADTIEFLSDVAIDQNLTEQEIIDLVKYDDVLKENFKVNVDKLITAINQKRSISEAEARKPIEALYDKYSAELLGAGVTRDASEKDIYTALQTILKKRADVESQKTQAEIGKLKAETWKAYQSEAPMSSTDINYLTNQVLNRRLSMVGTSMTADEKTAVKQELARRGIPIPRELTVKEKNAQEDAIAGIAAVDQMEDLLAKDKNTLLKMKIPTATARSMAGVSEYETAAGELGDIKTRIRTGAALNEAEIAFYQSQLPIYGDDENAVKNKLNQLRGFYLGMAGLPVTIKDPETGVEVIFNDLFEQKQRLGLREAINNGYELIY